MISIIIPTCNEAGELPATLKALDDVFPPLQERGHSCPPRADGEHPGTGRNAPAPERQVLVVDAGSTDGTTDLAAAAGAIVVHSPRRQRAAQMNLGVGAARGDVLLFLHADTRPNPGSLGAIETALRSEDVLGGAFARRFDHPSRLLALTCQLADWRSRWLGWSFGDQAIFARRSVFEALGGFREWDVFEDLDFARRLHRLGRTVLLKPPILSSARRFREGVGSRVWRDFWLTCCYAAGTHPQVIAAALRPQR